MEPQSIFIFFHKLVLFTDSWRNTVSKAPFSVGRITVFMLSSKFFFFYFAFQHHLKKPVCCVIIHSIDMFQYFLP